MIKRGKGKKYNETWERGKYMMKRGKGEKNIIYRGKGKKYNETGKRKKNMMKRGKGEKMKEEHVWKAKKGMRKMKCEGGGEVSL